MEPKVWSARLFDDNPAVEDLLGFSGVAEAVVRVVTSGGLDPVTVGVQGGWGGGKSTVLNLVAGQLAAVGHVLVVRVDPWEFEDAQDVRGTLIAQVLNALQELVVRDDTVVPADRKALILAKLQDLRRRIAWGRVARVLVTSAVSMSPNIEALIEALTPEPPAPASSGDGGGAVEGPQSMAGFRADFEALMGGDLGLTKVVVLVDDLDRCLPAATVSTLEAIKLFLSVRKMAFVLAADEDLIRASIDAHLGGLGRGEFATRYTEKIVQLPISLPVLSQQDAEAYVALLLGGGPALTGEEQRAMTARALDRRSRGLAPYVVQPDDGTPGPDPRALVVAATVGQGLSADMWQTPRAVKRFLNNLAVRETIARAAGATLDLGVLTRLYVLELRHPAEFKNLVGLTPEARASLLRRWEEWGRQEDGAALPDGVDKSTRAWAATEPALAGRGGEIDRYLSVAATLRADVRFGGAMDAAQREAVEGLLSESDAARRKAQEDALLMALGELDVIVKALGEQMARLDDPEHAVESLTRLAAGQPLLAEAVGTVLLRPSVLRALLPHHVPPLAAFPAVLWALTTTPNVDPDTKVAAAEELGHA